MTGSPAGKSHPAFKNFVGISVGHHAHLEAGLQPGQYRGVRGLAAAAQQPDTGQGHDQDGGDGHHLRNEDQQQANLLREVGPR